MHNFARTGRFGAIMALLIAAGLGGCGKQVAEAQLSAGLLPPVMNPITDINQSLRDLPPPSRKVVVAVYNYSDQTGQFKPVETTQTLSKAVTQGSTSILIKALQDVGNGSWFTVVERERIDNLLKERNIITQMRSLYLGEKRVNPKALPPLLFAGIIFEGGIIGYDSNLQTGGVGARLLGIGGDIKYRLDTITVYLRAVSTKTGQVVASVTTHKTIASVGLQGGVFKFIAVDKILEAEAGFTKNEPEQLAVQQAIEKAVHSMVIEGSRENVWAFQDKTYQDHIIGRYDREEMSGVSRTGGTKVAATPAAAQPAATGLETIQLAQDEPAGPQSTQSMASGADGVKPAPAGAFTTEEVTVSGPPGGAPAAKGWKTSSVRPIHRQGERMRDGFGHSLSSN